MTVEKTEVRPIIKNESACPLQVQI